jgi:hypothetical protein
MSAAACVAPAFVKFRIAVERPPPAICRTWSRSSEHDLHRIAVPIDEAPEYYGHVLLGPALTGTALSQVQAYEWDRESRRWRVDPQFRSWSPDSTVPPAI